LKETVCDTGRQFYKHWTSINLRYGDTDRQGHINNAVYCTLMESGRVGLVMDGNESIAGKGTSFVIARLTIDYLAEMHFPGIAEVGCRVLKTGRSSFTVGQAIFLGEKCYSTAAAVVVLVDDESGRPIPLTDPLRVRLAEMS
jgi:acyl-CoA thioester hydrolase